MKEKRSFLLSLLLMLSSSFCVLASNNHIEIHQTGQMPTHGNIPMPAETPDVYFNNDIQLHIFISFTY